MTKILVTGASGLLGHVLVNDLAAAHDVVAVVHDRRFTRGHPNQVVLDLTDGDWAERVWATEQPDLVVHTAALASLERCEARPDIAQVLNCDVAATVAKLCRDYGARLVHISTDAVFDGTGGPYRESDPVRPLSVYARTKAAGEQACLEVLPETLVARVNFFGPSGPPRRGIAAFFLDALAAGRAVDGFVDVEFSPLYSRDLADMLMAAVAYGVTGIRHVAARGPLTKHAFGQLVAEVFGYDPGLVREASVESLGNAARRGRCLSLDSGLLTAELGSAMPSVRDGIERLRHDLAQGYETRLVQELTTSDR